MLQFKDDQISGPSPAFIISENCNGSQKCCYSFQVFFFFLAGFSLQNVSCMPFKRTCGGLCSQRSGGVSLLEESPWYLVFSWGNRFLGFIAQEEFMELKLLSRGKAERRKASLVSLFHCFAIAGGSRKQTPNFFQFCADLQVVERKFVSGVSREALLVGCFLASLFH